MTELDFLSPEVENEAEAAGEDLDSISINNPAPSARLCEGMSNNFPPSGYGTGYENESGKETVEICQKTVNPHNRVSSENFNIQRVIGKGGYGKVFLVQKVDGVDKGKLYAMKVLKKARLVCNEKDKAHTVSERNILEMLRHPFLVRLHYAFQNHSNLYIVLEYCPGGELFNYLEREGALLENSACFYAAEIVLAIGHLHSLGIIYRDLKSENVLLDRQGHVKLTDFGLSKEGVCTTNTFCGTIEYMAPEIIKYEGHGKAVDWWSLGTLLFDMLSGGPPFSQEESREATTHKILTAPLKFPPSFSPEVTSLIKGLLKRDPKERLGSKEDVEEIKRHKFFRRHEINWSDVFHRRLRPPFKPHLLADNDTSMFDPTFTRLQPIVSPSDGGRSIPTDLFQGFSYVAQSVCEDSTRDTWTETNSISRRRHHGDRATLSAGRLRRLGVMPCHWTAKPDGHSRNSHMTQINPGVQQTGSDLSAVPAVNEVSVAFPKHSELCLPTHPNSNQYIKPTDVLLPSASQATLIGRDSELELDPESACGLDNPADTFEVTEGANNGKNRIAGKEEMRVADEEEDVDEDDEDDDEELEEENVPGAKQIQQTHGCTFYIPPNPTERPTAKEVMAFNFTRNPAKDEKSRAFPLAHSASGNQLRTTQPHGTYRSHVDLKVFNTMHQGKGESGHFTPRLVHSNDYFGALQVGSGSGRRPGATQPAPQPSSNSQKNIFHAELSSASSGSGGTNGVVGTTASPHQNGSAKCSVM